MTVVARRIVSIPARSARETWDTIVALIAPDPKSDARRDLAAVGGVICSVITDEALREDALVVYGEGPRVRIYCLYGDEAMEGDGASESALGFTPTVNDWRMSVPCFSDDLEWVSQALARRSSRVTARAVGTELDTDERPDSAEASRGTPKIDRDSLRRG
jgi:hypothetical protein